MRMGFFSLSFALFTLSNLVCATLVNHTIDDHDPVLFFSTPPVRCQGPATTTDSCSLAGYNVSQLINGTLSRNVSEVQVTFTGSALRVILGNIHFGGAVLRLDGEDVVTFDQSLSILSNQTLDYTNTSLPYKTYALQLVSLNPSVGFDFDAIVYSSDDALTPSNGSTSPASTRTDGSSPGATTPTDGASSAGSGTAIDASLRKKLEGTAIAAALLGALLCLVVVLLVILLLVRARRGNDNFRRTRADEENPSIDSGQRAEQEPNLLAEKIRDLQVQLQAEQQEDAEVLKRTPATTSSSSESGPSVMRSLSTIKRPQLRMRTTNDEFGDTGLNTDGSLLQESERRVQDPPPLYER